MTRAKPPRQPDRARVIPQVIPRPDTWQLAPPAPWQARPDWNPTLADLVNSASRGFQPIELVPQARLSAVLVALRPGQSGPEVLLTRRSLTLRNHPGEVSFPGGRVDPDESALDGALREADEEVGLQRSSVKVHGELTHLNTWVSNSYIVPILATVPADVLTTPQTVEVDRVMWVPCRDLVHPDVHHRERWFRPDIGSVVLDFFELDGDVVWGATARILVDLLTRCERGQTPLASRGV